MTLLLGIISVPRIWVKDVLLSSVLRYSFIISCSLYLCSCCWIDLRRTFRRALHCYPLKINNAIRGKLHSEFRKFICCHSSWYCSVFEWAQLKRRLPCPSPVSVPVPGSTTSSSFTERASVLGRKQSNGTTVYVWGETYTDRDSDTDTDMYDVHLYKQVLSGKRINPIIEMGNGPK